MIQLNVSLFLSGITFNNYGNVQLTVHVYNINNWYNEVKNKYLEFYKNHQEYNKLNDAFNNIQCHTVNMNATTLMYGCSSVVIYCKYINPDKYKKKPTIDIAHTYTQIGMRMKNKGNMKLAYKSMYLANRIYNLNLKNNI